MQSLMFSNNIVRQISSSREIFWTFQALDYKFIFKFLILFALIDR